MKRTTIILCSLVAVFSGTSCTKDHSDGGKTGDSVAVTVYADILNTSRAHDGVWDDGDAIGIVMLEEGGAEILDNVLNYRYETPDGSGDFHPVDQGNTVYFPTDGSRVTFRAYYPFFSGLDQYLNIPVDVTDQSDLTKIDLLTADHLSGDNYEDPDVTLRFHHRLSKVIFDFENTDGNEVDLSEVILTVRGMRTMGQYDLLNERMVPDEGSVTDLVIPVRDNNTDIRYGIVIPRGAYPGISFRFDIPSTGAYYTAYMSDSLELEGGKQYTFHISLNRTEVTVTADIEDWIDGSEDWLIAQ